MTALFDSSVDCFLSSVHMETVENDRTAKLTLEEFSKATEKECCSLHQNIHSKSEGTSKKCSPCLTPDLGYSNIAPLQTVDAKPKHAHMLSKINSSDDVV